MTYSEVKKRPNRAKPGSGPYPTGPWFYPTLASRGPSSGPGYRVRLAEDTGTRRTFGPPGRYCPDSIEPLSPGHRPLAVHRGSVGVSR